MANFAAGDKVRLKSGGPEMVVDDVDSTFGVTCSYWNPKKHQKEQMSCREETLEKLTAPAGAEDKSLLQRIEALEARVKKLEETK